MVFVFPSITITAFTPSSLNCSTTTGIEYFGLIYNVSILIFPFLAPFSI